MPCLGNLKHTFFISRSKKLVTKEFHIVRTVLYTNIEFISYEFLELTLGTKCIKPSLERVRKTVPGNVARVYFCLRPDLPLLKIWVYINICLSSMNFERLLVY